LNEVGASRLAALCRKAILQHRLKMLRLTISVFGCLFVVCSAWALLPVAFAQESNPEVTKGKRFPRLPSDFEQQQAIVVSLSELLPQHANLLIQIVDKTAGHVKLLILANNLDQVRIAIDVLERASGARDHVSFCKFELDTVWLRDFGPLMMETDGRSISLDFYYVGGLRPKDERMPKEWARRTKTQYVFVPWTMHCGNFLCNGRGLVLTSTRIFDDNYIRFEQIYPGMDPEYERRKLVVDELKKHCHIQELVVLDPLVNEATRHVDMFAAFVAPDRVVVAQLDSRSDHHNAAILDRNAERLVKIAVGGRPLQVTRIQIPPPDGKFWSTYTNAIFANDLVLVPTLDSDPAPLVQKAIETYQRLLPDHAIVPIDTTTLKKLEGSLHCLSLNIPAFAPLPDRVVPYQQAKDYFEKQKTMGRGDR
jgi:agmatine/peptidylarginine deiminase